MEVDSTEKASSFIARKSERRTCLLVLYANGKVITNREVKKLALGGAETKIGRDPAIVDAIVNDPKVTRLHASIRCLPTGQWQIKDEGSQNGTFVDAKRVGPEWEPLGQHALIAIGRTLLMLSDEGSLARAEPVKDMEGDCHVSRLLFQQLRRAAMSPSTTLLLGPTGVGKELCARAIHHHSERAKGPFVAFSGADLSPNIIESELFGHTKNAFTGAGEAKKGLFQQAHGGTLFLDEIGELPLALQSKLLRVLETRTIRPMGSTEAPIPIDVKVVAATNRDLKAEIAKGQFRDDLYHRLAQIEIGVPSLFERRPDIPRLAAKFVGEADQDRLGFFAVYALCMYQWPGNIRELRNFVTEQVKPDDEDVQIALDAFIERHVPQNGDDDAEMRIMAQTLMALLAECGGNVAHVAAKLDCAPKTVRRRCKNCGVDPNSYRRGRLKR